MNSDELHESSSRPDPRDLALLEFFRRHPEMRQRIFEMTQRLESEGDKLDAHEIEDLVVEEVRALVRALGHATLSDWATSAEERAYQEAKAKGGVHLHEKKTPLAKHSRKNRNHRAHPQKQRRR